MIFEKLPDSSYPRPDNLSKKRGKGESFKHYRNRLSDISAWMKQYLQGTLIWDSRAFGTYIRNNKPLKTIN